MAGSEKVGTLVYDIEIDTAGLLEGQRKLQAQLDSLRGNLGSLNTSINRTEQSTRAAGSAMSSLSGIAKGLAAAISIHQITEYANSWVDVNNKLVNAVRAHEQVADVTKRVFDISQNTMSSLASTATLYGRLERATRSAGTSTADLVTLTSTINKGLAVSGATTSEASSTMTQLSQALASGVLRGEEFNSISENGSRLAVGLADSLGVTIGQLRKMAAQGKLTTEVVVNGLLKQSDQISKEYANTAVTMGQSFAVATNNITKFVGENASVNTTLKIFNQSVISLSENLNIVTNVIGVFAAILGGRYVGALAAATSAKFADIAAATAQSKATLASAESAQIDAAAKLRLAQASKSSAVVNLDYAHTQLDALKATNASTAAVVQHADAELASIKVNLQQIEAEKALETQRLKSQITEQGRIATATRMAELQRASSVLTQQAATAEAAASTARANTIAAAEAKLSAARIELATATGIATQANGAYIVSTEAAGAASAAATTTIGGLAKQGLALIGGPVGAAVIAGAALFYFYQKAQQAKQEAIDFADKLNGVIAKMKSMSQVQLAAEIDTATKSIAVQKDNILDLTSTVAANELQQSRLKRTLSFVKEGSDAYNYTLSELTSVQSEHIQLLAQIDSATTKLSQTVSKTGIIQAQFNGQFVQGIDLLKRDGHEATITAGLITQLGTALDIAGKAKERFNASSIEVPVSAAGQKMLNQLQQENDLLEIVDKRQRAVKKARLEAIGAGEQNQNVIDQAGELAGQNYDLVKAEQARDAAAKKSKKTTDEGAQKIADLTRQLSYLGLKYDDNSREAAVYNAVQAAGSKATDEQKVKIGQLAGQLYDAQQKQKDFNAAVAADPSRQADKTYTDATAQLKRQLAEKIINQQQYNEQSVKLEQDHQTALAQAAAEKTVTPQAAAAATVDPVQALANENARKLALIQQFEANKTLTEQQALALRNAQNVTYEKARTDAQWALFTQQSVGYQTLGAAVDAFGSSASSSLSSVITGTATAADAARSLANTILSSVIQSFVDMGIQQAKSAILGATTQQAAIAATTTAQVAATATTTATSTAAAGTTLAAWTPAALAASVGSFGAAAIIGGAALVSAFALSSALGKRKSGGSVSAGSTYQVGEDGLPEIYQASNGSQYMIPGDNGKVISNKDLTSSSGSGGVIINVNNYTSSGVDVSSSQQDGSNVIEILISDARNGGSYSNQLQSTFGLTRKATGDF